jgi:imidazolonepropionase-like amidohydrolase
MQVVRAGRVIDGTGAPPQLDQAIYLSDGTISKVGPGSQIPEGSDVIDLSHSTVLPGLFDLHVHLVFSRSNDALRDVLGEDDSTLLFRSVDAAREALRVGVTTVRDLGGRGGVTFRLRDAIGRGLVAGPRILAAGSPITITGGHCHFLGLEADGEAAVRKAARSQLKAGANCLKVMSTGGRMTPGTNTGVAQYSVEEIRAIVEEAQRRHVTVAAHGLGTAGIRNATEAGVTTIEHCNWLTPDGRVEFDPSVAALMAEKGTAIVPTLSPMQRSGSPLFGQVVDCMRRARQLGVTLVAGTDAGVSRTPFDSVLNELEIYVSEVGMTPVEAIRAGTGVAARTLGLADTVGTIAAGQAADLLVVDGDPSERIADLHRLKIVFQGGKKIVEGGLVLQ